MADLKGEAYAAEGAIGKIHEFEKFGSILGLERMTELLDILGNPQDELKVIHVAGTNGKGSTCKFIYSVLQECGYKVGLYTSPFLEIFNERIELDGAYISDNDLAQYTDRVLAAVKQMTDAGLQSPTEFEVITAIAFLYFKEKNAEYVVLEVGLGGRGDSTNVCKKPLISVITSISYDHTDRLGNTLAEIASEKAGIIKDGCPVVTSAEADEALAVIEQAAAKHGSMYFETRNLPCKITAETFGGCRFDLDMQGVVFHDIEISMLGTHQVKNAVAAIAALCILEENGDVKIPTDALYAGLKKAKQNGRFEIMSSAGESPMIIIDGAHNPDGALALRKTMTTFCSGKKILMVTGMLADKDTDTILREFTQITGDFIVTEPVNPRKMSKEELKAKIEALGGSVKAAEECEEAFRLAACSSQDGSAEGTGEYDVILFAGSLYLIGEIRALIRKWRENKQE